MSTAMSMPDPAPETRTRHAALSDPSLHRDLLRYARRRVSEHEADDVVQATLTDALAAERGPDDPEEVRRWVYRIARNKIVDHYRRGKREQLSEPENGEAAAESAPVSARDLLRWAEKELPPNSDAEHTLEWMLREGDGEKLEHIADDAQLPAPRVRQRVSRMRKHYRARWAAQLAAAALFAALLVAAWFILRKASPGEDDIAREDVPSELDRAREIRRRAFEDCDRARWDACLRGLDEAKQLDPAGDSAARVGAARTRANASGKQSVPVPNVVPPDPAPEQVPPPQQKLAPPSKGSSEFLPPTGPTSNYQAPQNKNAPPVEQATKAFDDLPPPEPAPQPQQAKPSPTPQQAPPIQKESKKPVPKKAKASDLMQGIGLGKAKGK
jgi:RNA polymerase sigma factor (sigma-70 family)